MNLRPFLFRLFVTLTAFTLAGCGEKAAVPAAGGPKPLTKIILQTDWYAQPEHGGFYQALAKGYYRDAGLDVSIEQGGPNTIAGQKLLMGDIQFCIGRSDDVIVTVARGLPVVIAGALMQRDPQAIMFHKGSGIHGFKDLDGRNVMTTPGANFIPIMEKKYGIKISITPLDFGLSRFLADPNFVQQCFITNEPFYVRKQGADIGTLLLSDTGFSPYRVWFTSRKFATENPEAVRAFTAASVRGWREYMEGDRTAANDLIRKDNKQMMPEFMDYGVSAMKQYQLVAGDPAKGETYGQIRPERIAEQIRQLVEIGVLEQPLKVEDVLDGHLLLPAPGSAPAK
jgi:NitT/TauT family transport system substrate-binding protein